MSFPSQWISYQVATPRADKWSLYEVDPLLSGLVMGLLALWLCSSKGQFKIFQNVRSFVDGYPMFSFSLGYKGGYRRGITRLFWIKCLPKPLKNELRKVNTFLTWDRLYWAVWNDLMELWWSPLTNQVLTVLPWFSGCCYHCWYR